MQSFVWVVGSSTPASGQGGDEQKIWGRMKNSVLGKSWWPLSLHVCLVGRGLSWTAGLRPWDNTLISPPQTGDGVHGVGVDLTRPHLPLMLRHNRDRAESRCSQRSGELSLTHSSGSNWVRLSPEATEMTASGEADSPLVKIQVLLWLRELLTRGRGGYGEPGSAIRVTGWLCNTPLQPWALK